MSTYGAAAKLVMRILTCLFIYLTRTQEVEWMRLRRSTLTQCHVMTALKVHSTEGWTSHWDNPAYGTFLPPKYPVSVDKAWIFQFVWLPHLRSIHWVIVQTTRLWDGSWQGTTWWFLRGVRNGTVRGLSRPDRARLFRDQQRANVYSYYIPITSEHACGNHTVPPEKISFHTSADSL